MNKKGNLIMAIDLAFMLFVSGIMIFNVVKSDTLLSQSTANLDCDNPLISDGTKVTCLAIDSIVPYLLILIISLAGGIVLDKFAI